MLLLTFYYFSTVDEPTVQLTVPVQQNRKSKLSIRNTRTSNSNTIIVSLLIFIIHN